MALWQMYELVITPDYSKTVAQVYEDMTMALIKRTHRLHLLCGRCVKPPTQYGLPSWVYDWESKSHKASPFLEYMLVLFYEKQSSFAFNSTRTPYQLSESPRHPGELPVQAKFLGKIIALGSEFWDPFVSPDLGYLDRLKHPDRWYPQQLKLHEDSWKTLENWSNLVKTTAITGGKGQASRYSLIHSLAVLLFGMIPMIQDSRLRFLANWSELVNDLYDGARELEITNQVNAFALGSRTALEFLFPRDSDVSEKMSESESTSQTPNAYHLQGTQLFITSSGYVGIAVAGSIEEHDQLAIVAGSAFPLIIRPKGERFELESPCLVAGIMNGEAWHDDIWPAALNDIVLV
jgi:hypothetical protein